MVWQAHLISALAAQAGVQVLRTDVRQHCRSRVHARAAECQLRPAARARWGIQLHAAHANPMPSPKQGYRHQPDKMWHTPPLHYEHSFAVLWVSMLVSAFGL